MIVLGKRIRIFLLTIIAVVTPFHVQGIEISETPLDVHVDTPPPNVMIVWDDSESMDLEFVTSEHRGIFSNCHYLFPESAYSPALNYGSSGFSALSEQQRYMWRSQWGDYNRLYYRPEVSYAPWPKTKRFDFKNAHLQRPLSNPACHSGNCVRFRMSGTFLTIRCNGDEISIPNAHYFTFNDQNGDGVKNCGEQLYLVTWQDADDDGRLDLSGNLAEDRRRYYRFIDDGDHILEDDELTPVVSETEKESVRPRMVDDGGRVVRILTDREELQNFANWFSYHRKRSSVSKSAVASAILDARNMNIGLYAVNGSVRVGVLPVQVNVARSDGATGDGEGSGNVILDESEQLLDEIYASHCQGPSTLRDALYAVGRYFMQGESDLGPSPFRSDREGGGCQRSHAIIIAGGYYEDTSLRVGNADGRLGTPFADSWGGTLADIAMHFYESDLAPDFEDRLPAIGCDDASHQHMVTHTVWIGGPGVLGVERLLTDCHTQPTGTCGGGPCLEDRLTAMPVWPLPIPGRESTVDDLFHAAVNGRGFHFRAAQHGGMCAGIGRVLDFIGRQSTSYGTEHHGPQVVDSDSIYKVSFRSDDWSGDVQAFDYDALSGEVGKLRWSAAAAQNSAGVSYDTRRIVTFGGIWRNSQGIPFRYGDLSEKQRQALGSDLNSGSTADDAAKLVLDYIRGMDAPQYRPRSSLLGDIVNSVPVIDGKTLFVSGNDGMLHAFDIVSGEERFAYVPNLVFGKLKELASPGYVDNHRFFVDGSPSVGEVLEGTYQRKTYLIGGLGKGGRGYFCLLIGSRKRELNGAQYGPYQQSFSVDGFCGGTPEQEVAQIAMWEYPPPDISDDGVDNDGDGMQDEQDETDLDVGYSLGRGYVVNANTPAQSYRSVVIFGNGYNSPNGKAVLYVVGAADGKLIRKIDTGVAASGDNGLSVPALIDVNGDRLVDYAYAGDLEGNLWKFDLRDERPNRWGVAYGVDTDGDGVIDAAQGDIPAPVFRAKGQPITGRPDVMAMMNACAPQVHGNMVIFGTGRYVGLSDRRDSSRQSVYGIWDYGEDSDDSESIGTFGLDDRFSGSASNGLMLRPIEVISEFSKNGDVYRQLSEWVPDFETIEDIEDGDGLSVNNEQIEMRPNPKRYVGWYFDLPASTDSQVKPAERVISDVVIRGGNAVVTSYKPNGSFCAAGGSSWCYILNGCGEGAVSKNGEGGSELPKLHPSRLHANLMIIKKDNTSRLEHLIVGDHQGRLIQQTFMGEYWGKIFWRQGSDQ